MKKTSKATDITRENLTEAFWQLYSVKKPEHITVKEITDMAGYHRSTFYEYFDDIYELLNQVENDILDYIKKAMRKNAVRFIVIKLDHPSFEDFSMSMATEMAAIFKSKGKYLSILLGDQGDPSFVKKIKKEMKPVAFNALKLPESSPFSDYLFEFVSSAILAAVASWYNSGQQVPTEEFFAFLRSMISTGVLSQIEKIRN